MQNGLWLLCKSSVVSSKCSDSDKQPYLLAACRVPRGQSRIWGRTSSVLLVATDLFQMDDEKAAEKESTPHTAAVAGLPFLLPSTNGPSLKVCMANSVEARSFLGRTFWPLSPGSATNSLTFWVCMMMMNNY